MRARHRTSTGRGAGGRPGGPIGRRPDRGHGAPSDTGRVGYRRATLYARPPQPAHQDAAPHARPGRRSTTPDTSRHPSRTLGNVPTSGRLVYTSKRRFWLALGKTSARYGDQVPTPHYGQPRYRVIADELRERIESGAIPPGSLLPAESVLTAEFRAARGTIRKAIAVLTGGRAWSPPNTAGAPTQRRKRRTRRTSRRQSARISADARLATLFQVEIGTTLIEREKVIRRGEHVEAVVRAYHVGHVSR